MTTPAKPLYEFGPFRVDAANHLLLRHGEVVPLKPKVFDTLLLLVENRGRVLDKDQLMRALWPDSFVEESNLTQNVYALRKALGEGRQGHDYVETVPKRGYRFVAEVSEIAPEPAGPTTRARDSTIRSIAVLPFKPLIAGSRDEYFELGIADALITTLSNSTQLAVRSTSAVSRYPAAQQDPLIAGRELDVDLVLDGCIQRTRGRVRVTARLLNVSDGSALWADKFDGRLADIFDLQDSISERIAAAIAPNLSGPQRQRLTKRYTVSVEAYHLYLKGRYNWNKATAEGLWRAVDFFKQAIAVDPNYALAYTGLSDAYTSLDWYGVLSTKQSNPQARAAAEKALEMDGALAGAHVALAKALQYEWNWAGAEAEYRRAIELNPNDAAAHQWYAVYLTFMGRCDQGLAQMRQALELDPSSLSISAQTAMVLLCARRYDEAFEQCLKTLEVEPAYDEARFFLAMTCVQKGLVDEAIAEYSRLAPENPDFKAMLGHAYAVAGRHAEARAVLRDLELFRGSENNPLFWIALLHVGLGDRDAALACLEEACENPDDSLIAVKVFPFVDPLRSDSRFLRLLRRMDLA